MIYTIYVYMYIFVYVCLLTYRQVRPFRPLPHRWPMAAALPVAAWLEGLPLRPRCTPSSSEVPRLAVVKIKAKICQNVSK